MDPGLQLEPPNPLTGKLQATAPHHASELGSEGISREQVDQEVGGGIEHLRGRPESCTTYKLTTDQ